MKVKELKDAIADLPDGMEIILQKDIDNFSPLSDVNPECIRAPYSDGVCFLYMDADDVGLSRSEWEGRKAHDPRVLVLFSID